MREHEGFGDVEALVQHDPAARERGWRHTEAGPLSSPLMAQNDHEAALDDAFGQRHQDTHVRR